MFPLSLVLLLAPSEAAPAPQVALGAVDADEQVDTALLPQIRARALEGFAPGRVTLAPLRGDCASDDRACFVELANAQNVSFLIEVRVRFVDPDFRVEFELVDGGGAKIAETASDCEICGQAELLELVEHEAGTWAPRLERLQTRPARLRVDGGPRGASVRIDGEIVGSIPYDGEWTAGEHTVRIEAPGYMPLDRVIELHAGVTESAVFELSARPDDATESSPPSRRKAAIGWALLGTGLAATGAGVGLWVIDGRDHESTCPAGSVDVNGACPNVFTTKGAGIGLVAGGLAMTVGGAVVLGLARKDRRVQMSVGPRYVGVSGRF